jgi:hypothetical protein
MYFAKPVLDAAMSANDKRIANFYETFGFVVIKKFLGQPDFKMLSAEYNSQYAIRLGPAPGCVSCLILSIPRSF